ncbi:MAG: PAS domain S-box protein [Balneolaceae bacterium]
MNFDADGFREIIDALPMAIYTTDAEGRLTHFNKAAVEFSGRTPELGTDKWCVTWKLYYPDGRPMPHDQCPMAVALKEGRSISGVEAIAERPDGKRLWFEPYPTPLLDEDGKVIGGVNMLVNISENKEIRELQSQSEKELNDFFENSPLGLHIVGHDGTILRANKAELEMLGYTRDEYIGHNITEFHADKDVIDDILHRLKKGEELYEYEARLRCKDGSIRHVVINSNGHWKNDKFLNTRCFTRDVTKQKKAEKATRKSEEKYKKLFDSIDDGFAIVRVHFDEHTNPVDLEYLEVNPAYEKHSFLKGVVGKKVSELAPEIDKSWFKKYGNVALTGEPKRVEDYLEVADIWFSIYAFPIGDPEEHKVAIIFSDITERKESEHNNALLGAIVDSSDDAIISKKLDGTITSWNRSAEQLFGYSSDEAVGQMVTMLFPDERYSEENMIMDRIKQGERVDHFETVRKHKDGTFIDLSLTISPIKDSSGQVVGASKIARDITRRKEIEEEREQLLRKVETEQKMLSDVFQEAPSFMCILEGSNHVVTRVNEYYIDLIGHRDVVGKPVHEALPEVKDQGFIKLLDQVFQTGNAFTGTDMKIEFKQNGNTVERIIDFVYQPIKNSQGKITGIFVQGVDLTERSKAKAELQALNEALEQMNDTLEERVEERTAALLSYQNQLKSLATKLSKAEEKERQRLATELHDNLGQILAVSKMKIDLLNKEYHSGALNSELLELKKLINESIRYTRDLMSDLKPPPSLQKENLVSSLKWVADTMAKHDLEVIVTDDKEPKPLEADHLSTLSKCVKELLFNVLKHSGVDKAEVILSRNNDKVQVIVEDKGNGFNSSRAAQSPTNEGGFGLFNIRERLEFLGGSMKILSRVGAGTKIILQVPVKNQKVSKSNKETETSRSTEKNNTPRQDSNRKITVMLVDDHEMIRKGLKNLINSQDDLIVISEVSSGEEALQTAKKRAPDIIVMDINMPGLNGIEATRKVKELLPDTRVIGLSLHDSEEVVESMRNAGAAAYLTKSEAFETLCATIRSEAYHKLGKSKLKRGQENGKLSTIT